MFKNCCGPVCIDHTYIKLLVPGLQVVSNGIEKGNQYLKIRGTGSLHLHY